MSPHLYAIHNRADQLRAEAQRDREARAVQSQSAPRFPLPSFRPLFRLIRLA